MKFKVKCNDGKERVAKARSSVWINGSVQIHGKTICGIIKIGPDGYEFWPAKGKHLDIWKDPNSFSKVTIKRNEQKLIGV